jgi:putative peptidoglycan lipid II flippase
MNARETSVRALGKAVRTVSGFTLFSRVLGLVRDLVTVRIFGDGAVASAFAAAFAIPNLFRRLFGEGALAAAFIPEYAKLVRDEPQRAHAFASLTIGLVAVVTCGILVAAELALFWIVASLPPGGDRAYSLQLVMFLLPYMPLVCVAAMLAGMLQVHGRFAPGAAMPIILNLCIIVVSVPYFLFAGATPSTWAWFIGGSVLVSGALQVVWSLVALRGCVSWTRTFTDARDPARTMLLRLGPVLMGLGTLQVNSLVDTLIAMWPNWVGSTIAGHPYPLDVASNGILFFTQRLYQFPLGVFGIAVATAIFPALSRVADDDSKFIDMIRHGVRLSLFIAIPATVGLMLVRTPLIETLYAGPGGGFSREGVDRSAATLLGYAAGIWAYSLNQLWTRAFYARGDTATPMRIALAMVAMNLILNVALVFLTPLREAGLAWSTAASAAAQSLLLPLAFTRKTRLRVMDRATWLGVLRSAALALGMGAAVLLLASILGPGATWSQQASRLALLTLVGAGVIAIGAHFLRLEEFRWLTGRHGSRDSTGSA